jgi:signal transduction histidine kinase
VKESNRALKTAMETLELREAELARLNGRLQELDRLKSDFFANVSHELRTPLTLILGPLRRLLEACGPESRADLERIERNARILQAHVDDLLDLARLDAHRMGIVLEDADLVHLVRLEASRFESLAQERGDAFLVTVPERLEGRVDSAKFRRILANLLANAFKFTPSPGCVRMELELQGDWVRMTVEDSGPSIPEGMREAVFDRFRQVESGPGRARGGTGLGLALVREFARLHGGEVDLEPSGEGGARFRVRLPWLRTEGPVATAAEPSPGVPGLLERGFQPRPSPLPGPGPEAPVVLVVEDNADMADFLVSELSRSFRVRTAADGEEGLRMVLQDPPDLVLSDVMMPRMTGDRMAQAIRARPELDTLPLVLLTAKADASLRIGMLGLGVQEILFKPFSTDELMARVGSLLDARRRNREALLLQKDRLESTLASLERRESELRQLQEDLEGRVQDRTAALREANEGLESFSYSVSHDLRAPQRLIQGFGEALLSDHGAGLTPEARESVGAILDASVRMGRLTEGLLALARLGKADLRPEWVDLSLLAGRIQGELALEDPGRTVRWTIQEDLKAWGDPALVEVCLRNLLGNAWKYTSRTPEARIRLGALPLEGGTWFEVADNGAGFAMAQADRLFQPFRRLHAQDAFPGIGIGLATVHRVIQRHGGRLEARGEPGRGAAFRFLLPVPEEA